MKSELRPCILLFRSKMKYTNILLKLLKFLKLLKLKLKLFLCKTIFIWYTGSLVKKIIIKFYTIHLSLLSEIHWSWNKGKENWLMPFFKQWKIEIKISRWKNSVSIFLFELNLDCCCGILTTCITQTTQNFTNVYLL